MTRLFAFLSVFALLTACGEQVVDETRIADLGEFRLGHNIVIASKMQRVPASRTATEEEWVTALTQAFDDRFARYQGNQLYHFGISVEGYILAPPGVPVVAAPKSAVVLNVTIWDDAEARKLNEEPHQLLIFESLDEGLGVGSGYTSTAEEQLANLAFNASRELEKWLSNKQEELGWFNLKPGTEPSKDLTDPTAASEESITDTVLPADDTDPVVATSELLEDG
ncbi:MAG: hypothetical protein WAO69_17070 [Aestuariivita sp.]|uniref:hypothetical protein n=1 Tax=Aestuariivita sp. TaxID=1872407 RepID=UPI003BAFEE48